MKRILRYISVFLVAMTAQVFAQTVSLSTGSGSTTLGSTVALPISLSTQGTNVSSLQFTLNYVSSDLSGISVSVGSAATQANKTVSCNAPVVGSYTCLISGMNSTTFVDGVVATAVFTAATTTSNSSSLVSLSDVSAAGPDGSSVAATGGSGTITLLKPPSTTVSVAVTPATATLLPGQAQQFNASVTGSTNTGVTWSIGSGVGSISSSGLYTAPATIASTESVIVRATSTADTTKSSTATVSLTPSTGTTQTICVDANVSGDQGTPSTTVATPAFSTNSNNELLLAFIATDASAPGTTVTGVSGAGLAWNLAVRTNTQSGTSEIWRAFAPTPVTGVSVTATLSQSVSSSITVVSYTGVDTSGTAGSGAIGAVASGTAASGAPTASLVTTRSNSLVVGVGNDYDNAIARTPGSSQTVVHQYMPPVGDTYWVQTQNDATAIAGTTVTIDDTNPTADRYNLAICEILPAQLSTTPSTFTVSGAVIGTSAVTVTLSGTANTSTATTDASGNFTFSGIPAGTYTLTPAKTGFMFSPANQTVSVATANITGVNFTASPLQTTWTISGTVAPATTGAGATITVTGAATLATAADSFGNFSFSGLANGTYTVTPNKAGVTFTPANQTITINGANATTATFTAATTTTSGSLVIDATASGDSGKAASTVKTAAFSTKSGNELLLAFISTDYNSGPNTTVKSVSGAALTWALVARANAQKGTSEIWRAFAPSPLNSVSVTATLSQSVAASITVMSYSGVDTSGTNGSGTIGATASHSSSSGAPTASLTTTRNNSWVFGVGNDHDKAVARTVASGQTLVHQYLAPIGDTYWVQMQNKPTALSGTSVKINDIAPTGDRYNLAICEILPAQ